MSIVMLAAVVCIQALALAQDPIPTPAPGAVLHPPTIEPSVLATAQANEQAWQTEFESRSPFDFYIAYLIAPDAVLGSELMSEQSFIDAFGAQVFHSWDAFAAQNALTPFQIVMIHGSAYEFLDLDWTRWAYRNNILLVGVGVRFEQLVEITDDRCEKMPNPFYMKDQFSVWILIFTYTVALDDESYRDHVDHTQLVACNDDYEVGNSYVQVTKGTTNFPLRRPDFLELFVGNIVGATMDYRIVGLKPESPR